MTAEDVIRSRRQRVRSRWFLRNTRGQLQSEITDIVEAKGSMVSRDSDAVVPGTVKLTVRRRLEWTKVILEPRIEITDLETGEAHEWLLGWYLLETPHNTLADPQQFTVSGYDIMSIYNTDVLHSYEVEADQDIVAGLKQFLGGTDLWANFRTSLDIKPAAEEGTAPEARVWELSSSPTFLSIANDLLDTIGHRKLYSERGGVFASEPLQLLIRKPSVWSFNENHTRTVVGTATRFKVDSWKTPNVWLGVADNPGQSGIPTEFNGGIYRVRNVSTGPTSINARGREVNKIVTTNADNVASLVAVVEQQAERDVSRVERCALSCPPLPELWHESPVEIHIPTLQIINRRAVARSWRLPMDGGLMTVDCDLLARVE